MKSDVISMATADKETRGFYGEGLLLENRPEIFEGVGYLVNEGGSAMFLDDIPTFNIEVTPKVPIRLMLNATDTPRHDSAPSVTSSEKRILRAGARTADTHFERRAIPEIHAYFSSLAPSHNA